MKPVFSNNAASLLAAPLAATDLTIQLTAGFGVLFPTTTADQYFSITLENQNATVREIIQISSVTGDVLNVMQRGAENTTALAWTTNPPTLIDHRVTAGDMNLLVNTELISTVTREQPSGLVNGTNTEFTLANIPAANSESVYLNGILLDSGSGEDYTINENQITFNYSPQTGDRIRVSYTIS